MLLLCFPLLTASWIPNCQNGPTLTRSTASLVKLINWHAISQQHQCVSALQWHNKVQRHFEFWLRFLSKVSPLSVAKCQWIYGPDLQNISSETTVCQVMLNLNGRTTLFRGGQCFICLSEDFRHFLSQVTRQDCDIDRFMGFIKTLRPKKYKKFNLPRLVDWAVAHSFSLAYWQVGLEGENNKTNWWIFFGEEKLLKMWSKCVCCFLVGAYFDFTQTMKIWYILHARLKFDTNLAWRPEILFVNSDWNSR